MRSSETTFRQKIFLIAGSVCLTFILLELGLRAGGFVLTFLQERHNRDRLNQDGVYRIVCVGESTTALGGPYAYPNLLEKILNQQGLGLRFEVINKGMPGHTSFEIVDHLAEILDKVKPCMVIAMLGINDKEGVLPYQDGRQGRWFRFIKFGRVYKLFSLLKAHIQKKFFKERANEAYLEAYLTDEYFRKFSDDKKQFSRVDFLIGAATRYIYYKRFSRAFEIFEKVARIDSPQQSEAYAYWGWGYRVAKQLDRAKQALHKAIELDPGNSFAYQELAQCYSVEERPDLYRTLLMKAIEVDSQNVSAYQSLAMSYLLEGEARLSRPYLKKALELNPNDDRFLGRLGSFYLSQKNFVKAREFFNKSNKIRLENYKPKTKASYQKIKESVLGRGLQLVCVQYPMRSVAPLRRMLDYDQRVIFIDNESLFKAAVRQEGYKTYFEDLFAGDFGHCTPKGNALLAGNIARGIIKALFVQ